MYISYIVFKRVSLVRCKRIAADFSLKKYGQIFQRTKLHPRNENDERILKED